MKEKEYELILKAVLINKSPDEVTEVTKLLENKLDWREIAGVLLSHRLCGYFYTGLSEEQKKLVPKEISEAMKLIVLAQRIQQKNINSIINDVNSELSKSDI